MFTYKNRLMKLTRLIQGLILSCFLVIINACVVLLPTTTTPVPPSTTGGTTKPTTPSTTGSTTKPNVPTKTDNTKVIDPDNFIVTFKKPTSETYIKAFGGVAREEAKTSIADRKTEMMFSVGEVLKSLPTDSYMKAIGVKDNSPRSIDENRNVFIRTAYIFSIQKEDDGDFHIIIGDLVNGEKVNLMTAEIAGLPKDSTSKAYPILLRSRRQLYEKYPDFFEGRRAKFVPISKFPMIAIRGSLFFDTHHSAGQIGSGSVKPQTVWEIHPVTFIEFQEN